MKSRSLLLAAVAIGLPAAIANAQVALTDIGTTAPTPGGSRHLSTRQWRRRAAGPQLLLGRRGYHPTAGFPAQTFTTLNNAQRVSPNVGGDPNRRWKWRQKSAANRIFYAQHLPAFQSPRINPSLPASPMQPWSQPTRRQARWPLREIGCGGPAWGRHLAPGTNYIFGFGRSPGTYPANWEEINTATGLPYSGGRVFFGSRRRRNVTYSSTPNDYEMTFDLGLTFPAVPIANPPLESPPGADQGVLPGTNVTLTASAGGSTPMYYQWQTDGGSGGGVDPICPAQPPEFSGQRRQDFGALTSADMILWPPIPWGRAPVPLPASALRRLPCSIHGKTALKAGPFTKPTFGQRLVLAQRPV